MNKLKISLSTLAIIFCGSLAFAQNGFFGPNLPVVGGAAYCSSTTNGTCTNTVPAGPTTLTGNESIPANTNLTQGRSPQQVLVTPASLNANPITFVTVTSSNPTGISASNISGGVYYSASGTITNANITLPLGAIHNQQYVVSANRTITTLSITAASGDSISANTTPTVMTASTTAPQGFRFVCNKTSGVCVWGRLQ